MFFNRTDFDLGSATPGSFALSPHEGMVDQLRIDYRAMTGMIFGDPPEFEDVLATVVALEQRLNATAARKP
jgi:hypothetical protein